MGAAQYLLVKGYMLQVEILLRQTLAVKLQLDHKPGRFDLLLIKLFPQFTKRVGIQRLGVRIVVDILDV